MVEVRHIDLAPGLVLPATKIRSVTVMTDGTVRLFYECDVPPAHKDSAEQEAKLDKGEVTERHEPSEKERVKMASNVEKAKKENPLK